MNPRIILQYKCSYCGGTLDVVQPDIDSVRKMYYNYPDGWISISLANTDKDAKPSNDAMLCGKQCAREWFNVMVSRL